MNDASLPVELVIFDLGGTIVDFGCMAPVQAFVKAFAEDGLTITVEQARAPMGLGKLDHVRELFRLPSTTAQWSTKKGRTWSEEDVVRTYERFVPLQTALAKQHVDPIPGLSETWSSLREGGIAIGTTTGYPREITQPILSSLADAGFAPDAHVCTDEVELGRPAPDMIQEVMKQLGVDRAESVVNVGDTKPDMQSARKAGVWAVGISESGSEFGMTKEQLAALAPDVRAAKHEAASAKLCQAGAHVVVRSLAEVGASCSIRWISRCLAATCLLTA